MNRDKDICKKVKIVGLIIIIVVSLAIVFFVASVMIKDYASSQTRRQIEKGSFIEKNTIGIELPEATWYLDKRMDSSDRLYLCNEMDWLYTCKLYKDFAWYPNAYLVYSSVEFIREERQNNSTMAYYTKTANDDRYIFVWETTYSSILHELAHFADDVHGYISQDDAWNAIYQEEWENNAWLKLYQKENLTTQDQESLLRMEAFAEGFAQWYVYNYEKDYFANLADDETQLSHLIMLDVDGIDEESYPRTFSFMENFYDNYQFNELFMQSVAYGYTSVE